MKELDLIKEQNRIKPIQSTFKQFFRNEIQTQTNQNNLSNEIPQEIQKREKHQQDFNNHKDRTSIIQEELLHKVQQDKRKDEIKGELQKLEHIIKSRKELKKNNLLKI